MKFVVWILCLFALIKLQWSHNLDVDFPVLYHGSRNDYFGYTVALLKNRDGSLALVSAPRANSTVLRDIKEPGVLYKCIITESGNNCNQIVLDRHGNTYTGDRRTGDYSYFDKKDGMFLGVSLAVQQNTPDNHIVTCGHLWKNQIYPSHYLVNGVCYAINSDLDENSVKKLVPLINKRKQSLIPPGIYYYSYAQAGTSAAFSEDGKHLLLGAPGFYDWSGTVLSYSLNGDSDDFIKPVIPDPPKDLSPESYVGYSVTTGKFFGNDLYIVLGAPRDKGSHGQVHMIKAPRYRSDKFSDDLKKGGTQFGEYFGGSLLGIDLNNDDYTDLLVGAPFHSLDTGGDEGKVYIYISNGIGLLEQPSIFGESKPNARFGTCISNVGDINQDGYNDVAVGAPYEDEHGAVYIYHGSSFGLNTRYAQRIVASEISNSLSGFGISISNGVDIDNNYYPDILIGSYESSTAVLLRTRPLVQVMLKLENNPQQININVTSCEVDGNKVPCFNVTTCLLYTGKHSPMTLDFNTELYIDYRRQNSISVPRGYLMYEGKSTLLIRRKVNLEIGKYLCFTDEAYIRADEKKKFTKDVITPIDFLLNCNLVNERKNTFCKTCPIVDPSSQTNVTKAVSFQTGCGKDNKCLSDLEVKASILGNTKNLPLIIGSNKTLTIEITVKNNGEPAYLTELLISLPRETPNTNQDICELVTDQHENATLRCDIANPLHTRKSETIKIKIDISKLHSSTQLLTAFFQAKTASTDTNQANNNFTLPMYFKASSDISITGTAEHDQVPYEKEKPVLITHTYYVMNHGPSPLTLINIDLFIPTAYAGEHGHVEFMKFTNIETYSEKQATIPAHCNTSSIELDSVKKEKDILFDDKELILQKRSLRTVRRVPLHDTVEETSEHTYQTEQKAASTGSRDLIMNCETAVCMTIHCKASPFLQKEKFAQISISIELKNDVLENSVGPWHRMEYFTSGRVFLNEEMEDIQPNQHSPDEHSVKSIVIRPGPPPSKKVEKWIIFVSIGIGILLLIIILVALIKIGFFKRQQKDKMRQMMLQADLKEWEPYLVNNEQEPDLTSTT